MSLAPANSKVRELPEPWGQPIPRTDLLDSYEPKKANFRPMSTQIHTHTHTHTHIYTYIYTHTHIYVYIYIYI